MGTSVIARYRELFKVKGVKPLVLVMVVARLPTGCISILLILFVSARYGAAIAGYSTAALTIGTAFLAPFFGRLVDRGNGPRVLRWVAAGQALACTLLILTVTSGLSAVWVMIAAFLCGVLVPPVAGTTRSLWQTFVPAGMLSTAYSFEILLIDVLYVSGPLLASAFIVLAVPAWGIAFTTSGLVAGSVILSYSAPVKAYAAIAQRSHDVTAPKPPSILSMPAIWMLLVVCVTTNAFSGWAETLLPLFYGAQGASTQGAVTISVWSIGSIIGVLAFVRFQPSTSKLKLVWQLVIFTALYLATVAFFPLHGGVLITCVIMFCIGALVSPCTNLHYQLGGTLAPGAQHAEMFSWINTATSVGISMGAMLAGTTVESFGFNIAFDMPVLFVVSASLFAAVLAVWMTRRVSEESRVDK
jgi:MFS family permease